MISASVSRNEIVARQVDALSLRGSNDLSNVREWDQTTRAAILLRPHPAIHPRPMDASDLCHDSGSTKSLDDFRSRFHANIVAIAATTGKPASSDFDDRRKSRKSLQKGMARTKTFSSPPSTQMNQWVRDALLYAASNGSDLSYQAIADALTEARAGGVYDKSMVQKMTTIRKVSLAEAQVISRLTGHPIPEPDRTAMSLDERLSKLSEERQRRLFANLADLEAAEALDQLLRSSDRAAQD